MLKLAWLGTGLMRIVNIFLLVAVAIGLVVAGYTLWTGHYVNKGRQQVTTEIQGQNQKLDQKVDQTNTKIIHDVTHETQVIEHNTKDVEYVIRNSPSEPIASVTQRRLDVVYEQQRALREASQKPQ